MERYRLEVGHVHGVKPGNIVGAIANEAEIDSEYIGRVEIFDDYSTVDLPEGILLPLLGCATIKDIRLSNEFSDARRPISFGRVELLRDILIAL